MCGDSRGKPVFFFSVRFLRNKQTKKDICFNRRCFKSVSLDSLPYEGMSKKILAVFTVIFRTFFFVTLKSRHLVS